MQRVSADFKRISLAELVNAHKNATEVFSLLIELVRMQLNADGIANVRKNGTPETTHPYRHSLHHVT